MAADRPEIDVETLARLRGADSPPVVLDVREPRELAVCALEDALHIPMGEVPARLGELPADREIVVMCHHGVRSWQVTQFLRHQGFDNVRNLAGGIDAWAARVDPSLPRY
ncbi:sulfurtransferase [Thiohalorhabdus denitrificans]|uniref:Rhodanese-related sulfurtransferase n=1 Tax=Thiohalorhabdus denitrificans TaxID=381306 RepID=A0A0N8PNI3_9GAMM|nr:rhodanese-like domain-containing protein [Thiohalorhabdus denitrificans]KPV41605.1 sulfurtransferase [Thiohalorhabdus denitrificans]SCY57542.1 Rhodanese-related sulfurtransferase [Thiohalorhabdus denitrificans]